MSERDGDARRKRRARQAAKDVPVPACANKRRRKRLESDDAAWLRHYFAQTFWYDFTGQQREMIDAIRRAILFGGDQSIAASRGEGKTKLFEAMLTKYVLQGAISFAVLLAATGSKAEDSLESIKRELETNDRLLADYPEVCAPVRALENTPNRAHYQTVSGKRHDNRKPFKQHPSKFKWCGQEVFLPNVPGSPSAGAIIATRGLDSEVRGLNKRGKRPDVVCIDDPDTEETVNSEEQANKLEARIDRAVGGLGGQQKAVARVMLTTLQNRKCVSYRFTDRKQKPTWKGKRFRFLVSRPERQDLWEEYMVRRRADFEADPPDEFARSAHAFYLANREAMELGAEVANPNRFDGRTLDDGTQLEVSALERYFNEVVRLGQEAVSCEYDNDPPEETGPVESGITAGRIQKQLSGYPRKVVPPGCTVLTQGIDVRKVALHWVVRAWRPDCTGFTIDYGVQDVHGTTVGSDEGVDMAIVKAIRARWDTLTNEPYQTLDGQVMPIEMTLIDAGWKTEAVYHACRELGLGVMPAMGFGKSAGCVQANFSPVARSSYDRKAGDGWFLSRRPGNVWLACLDTDRWKAWEHDRWMTPPNKPGTMMLFGESSSGSRLSFDERSHTAYAHHIVSEVEIEEVVKGVLKRKWKPKSDNNHWLDASYMADVAAAMKGIRLLRSTTPQQDPQSRPSLADLKKHGPERKTIAD
jgi:hypothetical protein